MDMIEARVASPPMVIRQARADDAALVHALICELADYEKLRHEVDARVEDIARDLFGSNPRVFAEIAECDGAVVGFSLWFYNYSTFRGRHGIYLEDLFVRPQFRGKGIGKALLAYLARTCVENGWSRLQWSVLDWNAPSIAFYKSLGAVLMDEWTVCGLNGPALAALAERAP